jgi:hypothetical protein
MSSLTNRPSKIRTTHCVETSVANFLQMQRHKLDVHDSMHRDVTIKITKKMHYIDWFIIPNQLYMFRAMILSIIRSIWLYLQYLVVFTQVSAGWCLGWVETAKHFQLIHDIPINSDSEHFTVNWSHMSLPHHFRQWTFYCKLVTYVTSPSLQTVNILL